jgi:excisionase family DNA binding protein
MRIYSALEVANICGVVNQTAINWIRNGYLKAFTTPGGQYRVYEEDLSNFLVKRGMSNSVNVLHMIIEDSTAGAGTVNAVPAAILIIDHDHAANDQLKAQMETLFPEFEIWQAYDGFEAGQRLYQLKPGWVFLDVALPGINVFNLVKKIKEDPALGSPNVFALTQNGNEDILRTLWADTCFSQPVNPDKLREAVHGPGRQSRNMSIA